MTRRTALVTGASAGIGALKAKRKTRSRIADGDTLEVPLKAPA